MSDYEDDGVPYVVIERSGSGLAPFVWGALLGAAAALLLAPKSGAETQQELKERARRLRERAEEKADELQHSFQDAVSEGRRQFDQRYEQAKRKVSEGRSKAQEAIEAGREAAKTARSKAGQGATSEPGGEEGEEASQSA